MDGGGCGKLWLLPSALRPTCLTCYSWGPKVCSRLDLLSHLRFCLFNYKPSVAGAETIGHTASSLCKVIESSALVAISHTSRPALPQASGAASRSKVPFAEEGALKEASGGRREEGREGEAALTQHVAMLHLTQATSARRIRPSMSGTDTGCDSTRSFAIFNGTSSRPLMDAR